MRSNLATIQSAVSEARRIHSDRMISIKTPFFQYLGLVRDLPVADLRNKLVDYLNQSGYVAIRRPPKSKRRKMTEHGRR